MPERKSIFLYSPELKKYPFPPDHPFNTTRAPKTYELIKSMGWLSGENQWEVEPVAAGRPSRGSPQNKKPPPLAVAT